MNTLAQMIFRLKSDRRAVTAWEYGLIATLIGLGIVAALTIYATHLSSPFTHVSADL